MASIVRPRAVRLAATAILVATLAGCDVAPAASLGTPAPSARSGVTVTVTAPPGPSGAVERARVVRVVDGDTIVISLAGREDRVRYIGIDAPESVRPDAPVEPFGIEASAANAALVGGRIVLLERDVSDRDRFGRLLRYVWLETPEGHRLVNFELVASGFATAVTFPPDVRHVELLRAAERQARAWGRGLWAAGGIASPAPTGD
jgi:micrococcal nuclease